jgi:RNA binding exosome subunit
MRYAHAVTVSVFAKPEDDPGRVREGLLALFPFSLTDEEVPLEEQRATGFNERTITILSVILKKEAHITAFIRRLWRELGPDQLVLLGNQLESRLDAEHAFYLRLDKQALLREGRWLLTEGGDCYHIRLSIAAYPKTRESAAAVVRRMLEADRQYL